MKRINIILLMLILFFMPKNISAFTEKTINVENEAQLTTALKSSMNCTEDADTRFNINLTRNIDITRYTSIVYEKSSSYCNVAILGNNHTLNLRANFILGIDFNRERRFNGDFELYDLRVTGNDNSMYLYDVSHSKLVLSNFNTVNTDFYATLMGDLTMVNSSIDNSYTERTFWIDSKTKKETFINIYNSTFKNIYTVYGIFDVYKENVSLNMIHNTFLNNKFSSYPVGITATKPNNPYVYPIVEGNLFINNDGSADILNFLAYKNKKGFNKYTYQNGNYVSNDTSLVEKKMSKTKYNNYAVKPLSSKLKMNNYINTSKCNDYFGHYCYSDLNGEYRYYDNTYYGPINELGKITVNKPTVKPKPLPKTKTFKKGYTTYYQYLSGKKYITSKTIYKKGSTTTTSYYKMINGKNKLTKKQTYIKYKNKNVRTYYNYIKYFSNGRVKQNEKIYKDKKTNKYTKKNKTVYRSNGKKAKYIKFNYKKGKATKRTEYVYNKKGQLKSNKNGKSYRYITKYNKKGKATRTDRKQYNKKGKLGINKKVAIRRVF